MREMKSSYDSDTRKFVICRGEWANGTLEAYREMDCGIGAFACIANPNNTLVPWDWSEAMDEEVLPDVHRSCCVGLFLQCVVPDLHPLSLMGVNGLENKGGMGPDHFSEHSRCLVDHKKALVELANSEVAAYCSSDASSKVMASLADTYKINDKIVRYDWEEREVASSQVKQPETMPDKEKHLTKHFMDAFGIELSFID